MDRGVLFDLTPPLPAVVYSTVIRVTREAAKALLLEHPLCTALLGGCTYMILGHCSLHFNPFWGGVNLIYHFFFKNFYLVGQNGGNFYHG